MPQNKTNKTKPNTKIGNHCNVCQTGSYHGRFAFKLSEAVMSRDVAKPCRLPTLNSDEERSLSADESFYLAPYTDIAFVLPLVIEVDMP